MSQSHHNMYNNMGCTHSPRQLLADELKRLQGYLSQVDEWKLEEQRLIKALAALDEGREAGGK